MALPKTKAVQVVDLNEKNSNNSVASKETDSKVNPETGVSCKSSVITFSASETTASGIGIVANSMKIAKVFEPELNKVKNQQQQQANTNILKIRNNNENTNSSVKEKIMLFSNVALASNKPPILPKASNQRPLSQIIITANKPHQENNQNLLKNQNNQFASSYQSIFKNTPNSSLSSSYNKIDALSKNNSQNKKLNSATSMATNTTVLPSTTTLTSIETISLTNQCSTNRHILTPSNSNQTTKSIEKKNSFKSVKDKIAYFSSNHSQSKSTIGSKNNNNISKSIEIISTQVQNAIHIKKTRPKEWDSLKHVYNSNNNENSNEFVRSKIFIQY